MSMWGVRPPLPELVLPAGPGQGHEGCSQVPGWEGTLHVASLATTVASAPLGPHLRSQSKALTPDRRPWAQRCPCCEATDSDFALTPRFLHLSIWDTSGLQWGLHVESSALRGQVCRPALRGTYWEVLFSLHCWVFNQQGCEGRGDAVGPSGHRVAFWLTGCELWSVRPCQQDRGLGQDCGLGSWADHPAGSIQPASQPRKTCGELLPEPQLYPHSKGRREEAALELWKTPEFVSYRLAALRAPPGAPGTEEPISQPREEPSGGRLTVEGTVAGWQGTEARVPFSTVGLSFSPLELVQAALPPHPLELSFSVVLFVFKCGSSFNKFWELSRPPGVWACAWCGRWAGGCLQVTLCLPPPTRPPTSDPRT